MIFFMYEIDVDKNIYWVWIIKVKLKWMNDDFEQIMIVLIFLNGLEDVYVLVWFWIILWK